MSEGAAGRLEERRAQARLDLEELDVQVAAGEVDPATAERLRAVYLAEERAADEALRSGPPPAPPARSPRRVMAGFALFAVAAAAVTFGVVKAVEPRPEGGFVTGGIASETQGRNLAEVTNEELEAVVAANPDIIPMRLALARRYFQEGDFSSAVDHYLTVLEAGPNPEALAYVGWMTYLTGEVELGTSYLERSLQEEPGYPVASWFLANLRIDGGDPSGAIPLLESMLTRPDIPDEFAAEVEALLETARNQAS